MPDKRIPKHIAMIMDGNGRWAKEHDLPRAEGHCRGAEMIDRMVEAASDRGIKYLTLYAFSEENWNRPSDEVVALMQLLRHFLSNRRARMIEKGIRFRAIGDFDKLPTDVQKEIVETQEATASGDRMMLIVALSYGARQEICRAINRVIASGAKEISPEEFSGWLDTDGIPDPDLLIRTSGEFRISNFLLWQLAYSELYFTEKLWPDFDERELEKAMEIYASRERRFGLTSDQIKSNLLQSEMTK